MTHHPAAPTYSLGSDPVTGSRQFRLYQFEGTMPEQAELLIPHRKDHFLLVFIRHADARQWIDMTPYVMKDNTIYFVTPDELIVKEETKSLYSTGIAFTREFLQLAENETLGKLPLLQNRHRGNELLLSPADVIFVEDLLSKIAGEHRQPGNWQTRMLAALLTVLLIYLSRLYLQQYGTHDSHPGQELLRSFQAKVNECFREWHELSDYAQWLHLSPGHLSEVVKAQSGRSASRHIQERILLEARRLLVHTEQSSKEIAFGLGFKDASYFHRFFKRGSGSTPAEYRRRIREMYQANR